MLRNYVITALRNLVRNRMYAAINIVGLAVGFAAALLIALFVRDELSYDTWVPGHEHVYIMGATVQLPGAQPMIGYMSELKDAETLQEDFPEIAYAARTNIKEHGIRHDAIEARESIAWADPDFFQVMPLPALHGNPAAALVQPDAIVLTRRMALKYFGRTNVIGETLELDRKQVLHVAAVLNDLPSRTHLSNDIWVSGLNVDSPFKVNGDGPSTYLRLKPSATQAQVESRLPDWIDRHMLFPPGTFPAGTGIKSARDFVTPWLQPLSEIHARPRSSIPNDIEGSFRHKPSGNPRLMAALAAVGGLILFIAAANFVNLMTARAARRAIEVGVRKVTGAARAQLVVQFMGESFVYVIASAALAAVAVAGGLPAFNAFLEREITIEPWRDASAPIIATVLVLAVTLLGGLYPAFVLSAYRPVTVLKSAVMDSAGSALLRRALVVAQFAIFVGLILATLVMDRQTAFAMRTSFRVAADQLLIIAAPCRDALKNQIAVLDGVEGLACGGGSAVGGGGDGDIRISIDADGRKTSSETARVDAGLLELYGYQPLAGRFFDPANTNLDQAIINEQAVHEFGYASPTAAIGQRQKFSSGPPGPEVIGVVENFPLHSLQSPIGATVFQRQESYNYLAVKLDGAKIGTAMPRIEEVLRHVDATQPPTTYFYDQHIQDQYRGLIRQGEAFTAFAGVAILIAALGLFGLSAFTAEQRTKEIGIRKAMGATRRDILGLLLWQFARPVLWANVVAWPAAYFIMRRWLEGFALHIDLAPWMFVAASALALVIAVATVIGHALLVARAKPVAALRYE